MLGLQISRKIKTDLTVLIKTYLENIRLGKMVFKARVAEGTWMEIFL